MRENWKFGLAIVAALLISGVGAARADVIDGNWCNSDGRHFSIRGATISPRKAQKQKAITAATLSPTRSLRRTRRLARKFSCC
jgi:hypothetical protein